MKLISFILIIVAFGTPVLAQEITYGEFDVKFKATRKALISGISCTEIANKARSMEESFSYLNDSDRSKASYYIEKSIWSHHNYERCQNFLTLNKPLNSNSIFNVYEKDTIPIKFENKKCQSSVQLSEGEQISSISIDCYPQSTQRRQCVFRYSPRSRSGSLSISEYGNEDLKAHSILGIKGERRTQYNTPDIITVPHLAPKYVRVRAQILMNSHCKPQNKFTRIAIYDTYDFDTLDLQCSYKRTLPDIVGAGNTFEIRKLYCKPKDSDIQCIVDQIIKKGSLLKFSGRLNNYDTPVQLIGQQREIDSKSISEETFLTFARSWMKSNCNSVKAPSFEGKDVESHSIN